MPTPGLSSTGFLGKTYAEIVAELEADELATIDPGLDTAPDQPIGQLNGIFAKHLAEVWELLQTVCGAFDDTQVEGSLLESLCALTGTFRESARKSSVELTCSLSAGTVLPATAMVAVSGDPTRRFKIGAAYTSVGGGDVDLMFYGETDGPIAAPSGSLTVIVTPVAGWTAATNSLDATLGANTEEDPDLRIRRRVELRAQGGANPPATVAAVSKVPGVISCQVLENLTNVTDGSGRPPHSYETVVWDGVSPLASDTALAAAVFAHKPPGIQSYGSTSANVTDAYGVTHTVAFSRASQIPITVVITVSCDSPPADIVAKVQSAILVYGNAFKPGKTVVFEAIKAAAMAVESVYDIASCTVNGGASNVTIAATSIATFDTSRITVVVA